MSYWFEHEASGLPLAAYVSPAGEDQPAMLGGAVIPTDRLYNVAQTIVVSGSPVDLGPRPSDLHVMDVPSKSWVLPGPPVDPTPALVASLVSVIQVELDRRAKLYGYDDIKSAITYRGDPNPRFATEAEAFFVLRSQTWTTAYAYLDQAALGAVPFPIPDAEAISMMPALALPPPP